MDKISLTWAIVWAIICACGVIGIFWNPAHFVTIGVSAALSTIFFKEYAEQKPKSKKR